MGPPPPSVAYVICERPLKEKVKASDAIICMRPGAGNNSIEVVRGYWLMGVNSRGKSGIVPVIATVTYHIHPTSFPKMGGGGEDLTHQFAMPNMMQQIMVIFILVLIKLLTGF